MDYVLELDIEDFICLVKKLSEKENEKLKQKQEEMLLHRWGYELPLMKKPISFEEYKKKAFKEPKKKFKKQDNTGLLAKIEKLSEKYKASKERG